MSSIAKKLQSSDADVRFSGLEDLNGQILDHLASKPSAQLTLDIIDLAIALIVDRSFAVQNRAISLLGNLSKLVSPSTLVEKIFAVDCRDSLRALALKSVFKAGNVANVSVSDVLSKSSLWLTSEGCDAAYQFLQSSQQLSPSDAEKFVDVYLISNKPPKFSHGFDVLSMCLPVVGEQQWSAAKQVILSHIHDIDYISLVYKLVQDSQRWADFESLVAEMCGDTANTDVCEKAIKTLAAMVKSNRTLAPKYLSIALNLINYREFDEYSGLDEIDVEDDSQNGIESDCETDMSDEMVPIRVSACQLASAIGEPDLLTHLVDCLTKEKAEPVRQAIYDALTNFEVASSSAILENEIIKDFRGKSTKLVESGFRLFIQQGLWARLVYLISLYIREKHFNVDGIIDLLDNTNWQENPELDTIVSQVLNVELPASQLLIVYKWICNKKLNHQFLKVLQLCQSKDEIQIKIAGIDCLSALDIEDQDPHTILTVLKECIELINSIPSGMSRSIPLDALCKLASLPCVTEYLNEITDAVLRILQDNKLNDEEIKLSYNLLLSLQIPPRKTLQTILNHKSKAHLKINAFLSHIEKSIEFPVIEWAMKNHALALISEMASKDFRVLAWAFGSNTPDINAAAAKGCSNLPGHENDWRSFCDLYYKFSTTNFADLGDHELEFLSYLGLERISHNWYTLKQMIDGLNSRDGFSESHSTVVGYALVQHGDNCGDWFEAIKNKANRKQAFKAFTRVLKSPDVIFDIIKAHPSLQSDFEGKILITNPHFASKFAESFRLDPQFLLQTAQYLDLSVVEGMTPVLVQIVCDNQADGHDRCQALSILKCIFTQHQSDEHMSQILDIVLAIIPPNSTFVKKMQIGPFRMDLDGLEPARTMAMDCLMICRLQDLPASLIPRMTDVVKIVVKHSMKDPAQKTRLLTYRFMVSLIKDRRGRGMINNNLELISSNIEKELASNPKSHNTHLILDEYNELKRFAKDLSNYIQEKRSNGF